MSGMLVNICLRDDCGFAITVRRILSIKPYKDYGDYPLWYEYEEDIVKPQQNCKCLKKKSETNFFDSLFKF